MQFALHLLSHLSVISILAIFLLENILIVAFVLICGNIIQRKFTCTVEAFNTYSNEEWLVCFTTILLNTLVTYAGFWLWQSHVISFTYTLSIFTVVDFVILFFAMDLLMYIFHYIIHKTFLYHTIHRLHHKSVDPKPIDLFILHPLETLSFGGLWLMLLMLYRYNIYAVAIYLVVNIIFGLVGHLGIEPWPESTRDNSLGRYIGSSTFHHQHHQNINYNLGFYTTVWDRLFGTYNDAV